MSGGCYAIGRCRYWTTAPAAGWYLILGDAGSHTRNCMPEPYEPPAPLIIRWIPTTPYILLCDFKSLWQQDDLMDAANLIGSPWSWLIIGGYRDPFWIWGRRHANCCWSYYVFSAPKKNAERSSAFASATTNTIKNQNKHSPLYSCCNSKMIFEELF